MQSGIEVHAPTRAPSRRLITFQFKRLRGSTVNGLLRIHAVINVVSGIDAEEMALVPMVRILILPVVEPLLQIALLSYLIRLQPCKGLFSLRHKLRVFLQDESGIPSIRQTFTNHGQVGKSTITRAAMIALVRHEHILGRG